MSRSTVFWDTRCLMTLFGCLEERRTGDVPPQRRQRERKNLSIGHRLSASASREPKKRAAARILKSFFVADKRAVWIGRRPTRIKRGQGDTMPIRLGAHAIDSNSE